MRMHELESRTSVVRAPRYAQGGSQPHSVLACPLSLLQPLAPPPTAAWQPVAAAGSAACGTTPALPPLPGGGMPAQRGAAGVGSRYALAGSYAAPAAMGAASTPAPSLLPQAGGLTAGQPPSWQAGSHAQQAAASSTSLAAPTHGSYSSAAPLAAASASGAPITASGAMAAPAESLAALPAGPPSGLRIQHTRALSTDSTSSGWQPGMQFAAAPGTSTVPGSHPHASPHFSAMPFTAHQAGGAGFTNAQL